MAEWVQNGEIVRISSEKWLRKGKITLKEEDYGCGYFYRKLSKKGIDKKYPKDYIRSIEISTQPK